MNISQKRSRIIKKPTRPPHFSRCENKMSFVEAYEFMSDNADMIFYSTGNKTPFIAKATIGIKGSHKNKKVIRFFTKGTEKARAYSCCWGHITNCNRTYINCFTAAINIDSTRNRDFVYSLLGVEMKSILAIRERIYNYFHGNNSCQKFFFDGAQEERCAAYYTSLYLLQDTTESLSVHRKKGFSTDSHEAYIEFWGIMQAIIIQQDAICELYKAVTGSKLTIDELGSWQKLRFLRNTCAGHPARRDLPKSEPLTRTFMRRNFGDYSLLTYEKWEKPKAKISSGSPLDNISHPQVELGSLIDAYEKEAAEILHRILRYMESEWPNT